MNVQYVNETDNRVETSQKKGNVQQQIGTEYPKASFADVSWSSFTEEVVQETGNVFGVYDDSYGSARQQKYGKNGVVAKDSQYFQFS